MKKALFCLLVIVLTSCGETELVCPEHIGHVHIIAHRGLTTYDVENSLRAIAQTVDVGVDAVEFDVQLSLDGEFVVFHNEDLFERTGREGKIRDFTIHELKQFRLINHLGTVTNEEIPTLGEVLEKIGGKIHCFIDLKFSSAEKEKELVELLKEYTPDSMITILSFDHKSLARLHALNGALSLCLLLYDESLPPINNPGNIDYSYLTGLGLHYNLCKKHILENLKERIGVDKIYVYTVNTLKSIAEGHFKWIDGVITDNPEEWMLFRSECNECIN